MSQNSNTPAASRVETPSTEAKERERLERIYATYKAMPAGSYQRDKYFAANIDDIWRFQYIRMGLA